MKQHQQCIRWNIKVVLISQARKETPYTKKCPMASAISATLKQDEKVCFARKRHVKSK